MKRILNRVFKRKPCRRQLEINRLRKVLHDIADSRPYEHMDIEREPELTRWIGDTCTKAQYEAYPHSDADEKRKKYEFIRLYG